MLEEMVLGLGDGERAVRVACKRGVREVGLKACLCEKHVPASLESPAGVGADADCLTSAEAAAERADASAMRNVRTTASASLRECGGICAAAHRPAALWHAIWAERQLSPSAARSARGTSAFCAMSREVQGKNARRKLTRMHDLSKPGFTSTAEECTCVLRDPICHVI